jgi:hypothetical protein
LTAFKKGWISNGIQWREEFVAKDIDPDKFLALTKGTDRLAQYLALPPQGKVQFLNRITRSAELFSLLKIN